MPRAELTAEVYSTAQAQAALGVCAGSMSTWRRKGVLVPLVSTGNCNVYSRADVEAFAAAHGARFKRGRPPRKSMSASAPSAPLAAPPEMRSGDPCEPPLR